MLTSDELIDTVESLSPEHREREYPPTKTLSMFLAQPMSNDRSCQKVVNDNAIKCIAYGDSLISVGTGGYCRARKRLPVKMISELESCTGQQLSTQLPQEWLWRGNVYAWLTGRQPPCQIRRKIKRCTRNLDNKKLG